MLRLALFRRPWIAAMLLLAGTQTGLPAQALEGAAPGASAVSAAQAAGERRRLESERAAVEARFSERRSDCLKRFIVTSCLDAAKAERRQAIDRLRARRIALDETLRHARSAARKAELAQKANEDARREADRASRAAGSGAASAPASPAARGRLFESHARPAPVRRTASQAPGRVHSGFGSEPRPPEPAARRARHEAESRAAFEARQADAAEHRQQALERARARSARKKVAAPLAAGRSASAASAASLPAGSR